jgi:type III secretion protein J
MTLLAGGCGQAPLYSNVTERQANEMISLLRTRNLSVNKLPGVENSWTVVVANTQFANAVDILNNYGYPKDEFITMGKIFEKSGLVSSPTEERARFMYALSENLAETISHINGIVTARVNIVLPENNPYTDSISPSSAAVFVTFRPGINLEDYVRDIKYLVTNSIEGLSYDKVSVALFPAPTASEEILPENEMINVLSIRMTRSSLLGFLLLELVLIVAVAGASFVGAKVVLDYLAVRKEEKQKKQKAEAEVREDKNDDGGEPSSVDAEGAEEAGGEEK